MYSFFYYVENQFRVLTLETSSFAKKLSVQVKHYHAQWRKRKHNTQTMKQGILAAGVIAIVLTLSLKIYASTPPSDKHEFKNADREVNFDVERKQGEIALYFQSQVFNQYDEILVERSSSDNGIYSVCKTLEVAQIKINGDYYKTSDKYPLNAQKDAYYRIKTVSKEGIMKTFPPVLLTALTK